MSEKCIIVGAGNFDLEHIDVGDEDFCIAADGGMKHCRSVQLEPDLIIGDFDSVSGDEKEDLHDIEGRAPGKICTLPTEKDDTDMLAAIREGLKRGYRRFEIYGSQGGRLSHTIANIQCLSFLKDQGAEGILVEKNSRVFLIREETAMIPEEWQGYISLFSYGKQAEGVTIRNLKYELDNAVLTDSFPIGVSNEFIGKPASVTAGKGTLLAVVEFR